MYVESGLANIDPFTAYSALDGACGFSLTTTWGESWGLLNSRGALDLSWVLNLLRVSLAFLPASKISRVVIPTGCIPRRRAGISPFSDA